MSDRRPTDGRDVWWFFDNDIKSAAPADAEWPGAPLIQE
jgi:hypothetical protein